MWIFFKQSLKERQKRGAINMAVKVFTDWGFNPIESLIEKFNDWKRNQNEKGVTKISDPVLSHGRLDIRRGNLATTEVNAHFFTVHYEEKEEVKESSGNSGAIATPKFRKGPFINKL